MCFFRITVEVIDCRPRIAGVPLLAVLTKAQPKVTENIVTNDSLDSGIFSITCDLRSENNTMISKYIGDCIDSI